MSSEVTGKQQKYTRIGPREFVPFEFDEITFHNIVEACQKYFAAQIDRDMVCDIFAGERGPSCKMCQIPDHKVFIVRFIKMSDAEILNDQDEEEHEQETHKYVMIEIWFATSLLVNVGLLARRCAKFQTTKYSLCVL